MLRLIALHHHAARVHAASRAPLHLRQQLECALLAAVVWQVERHVRRDHTHERHIGEVMPLGDHLRSNEHLRLSLAERSEHLDHRVLALRGVVVHADGLDQREQLFQLFLHLLRAHAELADIRRAAGRTGTGRGHRGAAVVAAQRLVGGVKGHRDVAMGAMHGVAARTAFDEAGVAPAVVEQHHLLSRDQRLLDGALQRTREHAAVAVDELPTHVHDLHLGQGATGDAVAHLQQRVIAAQRARIGVDGGRRAAQHQRRALQTAALPRHLARVVAGMRLGLVGLLVLLVDHDQPQALHRREHRRARPNDHARLALADPAPFVVFFALRQPGVQHCSGVAKAHTEPAHHLRRQRDLRHQYDGALAAQQRLPHRVQVHLGLARAGDAMQQEGLHLPVQRGGDGVHRVLLRRRKRVGVQLALQFFIGYAAHLHGEHARDAFLLQRARHREHAVHVDVRDAQPVGGGFEQVDQLLLLL